jgi:uncharacterized protein YjbJ (UPF0337 family)
MANQQTLEGNWNEISGKLRSKWGQLSGDDLDRFKGNTSQLVGLIQRKTGEARDQIEDYIDQITSQGSHGLNRTVETASHYVSQAAETARESAEMLADRMREGYESAERTLQERPVQSVALAFGAGIVVGILMSVILRSDSSRF